MKPNEIRESLYQSLQSVSQSTEDVYLAMGETYPVLIKELEGRFGRQLMHIHDTPVDGFLKDLIAEAEHEIAEFRGQYQVAGASLQAQLQALLSQVATLDQLNRDVEEVQEDSVSMELISLNAMVVAAKAGTAGAAFSSITTELKKLSNQAVDLTREIMEKKADIDRSFGSFQQGIATATTQEAEVLGQFFTTTGALFTNIHTITRGLLGELETIHQRSVEVAPPLVNIMVEVQNQDRIRQSIDHVLLSLNKMDEAQPVDDLEAHLNWLTQRELLPQLCSHVLNEVQEQILDSRRVFEQNLTRAHGVVTELERSRKEFVQEYLRGPKATAFQFAFDEGTRRLEAFLSEREQQMRLLESMVQKSHQLQRFVQTLVERLGQFDEMLVRFRNIDMLSRIQVARHSALSAMKNNAQVTSELTLKIDRDVRSAIERATLFSSLVQSTFEEFRTSSQAWVAQAGQFQGRLKAKLAAFLEVRSAILEHLEAGQLFSQRFEETWERTTGDLKALDQLNKGIEGQQGQIESLRSQAEQARTRLLAEHHRSDWAPDKEQLKALVQKFTIFSHKKFAADLLDFDVEPSVASGEVTLF